MSDLTKIFDLLDEFRHLPNYQLERRADIFFALFIPLVINKKFGLSVKHILPEFPIRIGEISTVNINRSFKIDYAIFTDRPNHCFFIELKTDDYSRRDKQDWYLECSVKAGMKSLIDGILKISKASSSKDKYSVLISSISKTGLIKFEDGIPINVVPDKFECQVIFLQPNCVTNDSNISFYEMATIIETLGDSLALRFAKSLREWATIKAGKINI